jgi:purine-binding chemotaxis protein CheW
MSSCDYSFPRTKYPGPSSDLEDPRGSIPKPFFAEPQRVLLVFQLADRLAAVPLESVDRVVPMAELGCPPGLPSALEGVLNLAGLAVPVLRLDRLFGLRDQQLSLYSMLIVLRAPGESRLAILVDRVSQVLSVPENTLVSVDQETSFNGCAESALPHSEGTIHLLSLDRLLLARESRALAEFQVMAQKRLQELVAGQT